MARPQRSRKICIEPRYRYFGPIGTDISGTADPISGEGCIELTVDEYETIRLIDRVGMTQEQCARHMCVSRTTVTQIYDNARRKLSEMLVSGMPISIQGGHYMVCNGHDPDNNGEMCAACMNETVKA